VLRSVFLHFSLFGRNKFLHHCCYYKLLHDTNSLKCPMAGGCLVHGKWETQVCIIPFTDSWPFQRFWCHSILIMQYGGIIPPSGRRRCSCQRYRSLRARSLYPPNSGLLTTTNTSLAPTTPPLRLQSLYKGRSPIHADLWISNLGPIR
jgi:hypothetical protein